MGGFVFFTPKRLLLPISWRNRKGRDDSLEEAAMDNSRRRHCAPVAHHCSPGEGWLLRLREHETRCLGQGRELVGRIARFAIPGSDLSGFTQEELDAIAWKLNTRPRKSLAFRCPAELFTPDAFDFRQHHAALFAPGH